MITRRTGAEVDWASDRDVIKSHFKMRREELTSHEVQIYDDGNHHPMVLSQWHTQIKADSLERAAARIDREQVPRVARAGARASRYYG